MYNLSLVVGTRGLAAFLTTCLALAVAFAVSFAPALAATATRSVSSLLGVCRLDKTLLFVTVSTVIVTVTTVLAAALPGLVFVNVTCSERGAVTESKAN